ncbi:Uncharacterised protein [Vibrio cholerae]|uniref:Uncharacterized protein n=1 Tax=Vibrio cholerae TaxID=666 RepID=A0A655Y554_VIBCL|nr:Uncharacterised protein [Vibrio cholerae]CSB21913.1 Uncharacterised protein [Vibrio cholerae]CSB40121.1 Uncharacterised protein [Vibrio cholerae]CSC21137.1 Uncharacterised protein [Vibrio cholerae]CSC30705.1 Uncharacterised protein [Vibrio cholerae]
MCSVSFALASGALSATHSRSRIRVNMGMFLISQATKA